MDITQDDIKKTVSESIREYFEKANPPKNLTFDAELPKELLRQRHEMAIKRIIDREFPRTVMPMKIEAPRLGALLESSEGAGLMGKLLSAGTAGAAAPFIMDKIDPKMGKWWKALSIPIAALGGATLFDLIMSNKKAKDDFTTDFPMELKTNI